MRVLIFGGTVEGRVLAQWCAQQGLAATLCVATAYGASMAALTAPLPGIDIRVGRLGVDEMADVLAGGYSHVVDATHPYAAEATQHIRAAAHQTRTPYLRLVRSGAAEVDCIAAPNAEGAAIRLDALPGNILLTTGSKDLNCFARQELVGRCFPRVLPTLDSLGRCLDLGFPPSHIICMQGPFSRKLNEAIMAQYNISVLVTKNTGGPGGYFEKAQAARVLGVTIVVIDRPAAEEGYSLHGIQTILGGQE